jgi:hypothetical protein
MPPILHKGEKYRSTEPIPARISYLAFREGTRGIYEKVVSAVFPDGLVFELLAHCYRWHRWAICWPANKSELEKELSKIVELPNPQWWLFLLVTDVQKCKREP